MHGIDALPCSADTIQYIKCVLNPIMQPLVIELLDHLPDNPEEFLIQRLVEIQRQKKVGAPIADQMRGYDSTLTSGKAQPASRLAKLQSEKAILIAKCSELQSALEAATKKDNSSLSLADLDDVPEFIIQIMRSFKVLDRAEEHEKIIFDMAAKGSELSCEDRKAALDVAKQLVYNINVAETAASRAVKILETRGTRGARISYTMSREATEVSVTEDSLTSKALSHHYLRSTFLDEIRAAGFDSQATIKDIVKQVIEKKGDNVICPWDQKMGAAYVDCINEVPDNVGEATHMLSYIWGYSVSDIVGALSTFARSRNLNSKRFYVWICCVCVNQHRVTPDDPLPFEYFERQFRAHVIRIGHVLALMSPWKEPGYIKRVWTCFELYTAVTHADQVKLDIVMPIRESEDLKRSVVRPDGLDPVWKALKALKVEQAQAFSPVDQENIFKLIQRGPGFEKLNQLLAEHIRNWILDTIESYVDGIFAQYEVASRSNDADSWEHVCAYGQAMGDMCRRFGQLSRAQGFYGETRALCPKHCRETEMYARLLKKEGSSQIAQGDVEGALEDYHEALEIFTKIGKLKSKEGASLLNYYANAKKKEGDLEAAISANERSKQILLEIGQLQTGNGAYMLREYGDLLLLNSDYDGARQQFQEAMDIYEKLGKDGTPDHAYLLNSQAQLDLKRGDIDSALAKFQPAEDIHRKMGTLGTNGGLYLLHSVATAKMKKGDRSGARKTLREAKALHEANGTLESKGEGAEILSMLELVDALDAAPEAGTVTK